METIHFGSDKIIKNLVMNTHKSSRNVFHQLAVCCKKVQLYFKSYCMPTFLHLLMANNYKIPKNLHNN